MGALVAMAATATSTPPAAATTVHTVVWAGTMSTSGGMGLPCTPSTTPGGNKCNPGVVTKAYPLPGLLPDNTKVNPAGGNRRPHSLSSTVCVDTATHVNKPGQPFTHVGTCSFSGSGSVSGWCGLSLGDGFGTMLDSLGQLYSVAYNFNVIGTLIVVLGHATKGTTGQTGLLLLSGTILPLPAGTTCTNFLATQYAITLVGMVTAS